MVGAPRSLGRGGGAVRAGEVILPPKGGGGMDLVTLTGGRSANDAVADLRRNIYSVLYKAGVKRIRGSQAQQ